MWGNASEHVKMDHSSRDKKAHQGVLLDSNASILW